MHTHDYEPTFDFNLIKFIIFPKFKCSQKSTINHFPLFQNYANFKVLQFYPLKMNLIPEIRTMLTQITAGMFFLDHLLFPK